MAGIVHISEEEAVSNPKALFARVKAGETAIVHSDGKPEVMLELVDTRAGDHYIRIFLAPQHV